MGARTDLVTDPAVRADLLLARRGTSFWARELSRVPDAGLDEPSGLPGWSRRALVAHVGYNARAIGRLVEWATTGVETPMYASPQARNEEIEIGATLPPHALRHLSEHAAISLDVQWRDAPPAAWSAPVRTAQGRTVPLSATPWMRIREVWLHAVDLRAGATLAQLPGELADPLLADVVATWDRKGVGAGLALVDTDSGARYATAGPLTREVAAPRTALLGWATGRADLPGEEPAPAWL